MTGALMDAMSAWPAQHRASGKPTSVWAFAGMPGGGGLDGDSHEELDEIMAGFPWAVFSSTEVLPLADIDRNLQVTRAVFQR